jgi:hypothetical protein
VHEIEQNYREMPVKLSKPIMSMFLALFATCLTQAKPAKLTYFLPNSKKLIVYLEKSPDSTETNELISVAIALFDATSSPGIDLLSAGTEVDSAKDLTIYNFFGPLEIPKPDLVEGKLPKGTLQNATVDLKRNLVDENVFAIRIQDPYVENGRITFAFPLNRSVGSKRALYTIYEPPIMDKTAKRSFSFSAVTGFPEGSNASSLLVSLAETRMDNVTVAFGTVLMSGQNTGYLISKDWMKFKISQNYNLEIGAGFKGRVPWPNQNPVDVASLSLEPGERYSELSTPRTKAKTEQLETDVERTLELTNKLLKNPQIAKTLADANAVVLHSDVRINATVGSRFYYAVLTVRYENKNTPNRRKPAQYDMSWIVKIDHYSQDIIGTQKITPLRASKVETIFPGDFVMNENGKMEKLSFDVAPLACREIFK